MKSVDADTLDHAQAMVHLEVGTCLTLRLRSCRYSPPNKGSMLATRNMMLPTLVLSSISCYIDREKLLYEDTYII